MPSFSTIFASAALALAAFTSAAPLLDVATGAIAGVAVPGVADVAAAVGADVHVRDLVSIPTILNDVTVKLTPLIAELGFITSANATVEVVGPITDAINVVLSDAISEVNALAGSPVETILATVDGVLDVAGLAQILGSVLNLVFTTLGAVLALVGSAPGAVFDLLSSVGSLVGQLLGAVLSVVGGVVGGLLGAVLPLIGGVIPVLLSLNLGDVLSLLGQVL